MKKLLYIALFCMQYAFAQNLITTEQFASCTLPEKWSLKSDIGTFGFSIIKSNLMPQTDATCSILYQQANKTENGNRKFNITSKEFQLFNYDQYILNFGLRFIKTNANSSLKLFAVIDDVSRLVQTYSSDVTQNGIVLVNQVFTINTNQANQKLKFIFEYEAIGNDFNTIILIDNLNISGPDNDDCARAVELQLDKPCLSGNSSGAFFAGPKILCSGNYVQGIWYKYISTFTGQLNIQTNAVYNDAVSVFEGGCASLKDLNCFNKDEYGFAGERNYAAVETGKTYYIRVAKQTGFYGREDISELCLTIRKKEPLYPSHDICTNKKTITINSNCTSEENIFANFENPIPSLNDKSRADVWYSFKTSNTKSLEIISHADFADVLTVYKGTCSQLIEVKCEDLGGKLILENPTTNTEYFIQVSGYFSTIEGHLCIEVKDKSTTKPLNDDCPTSKAITLNQFCESLNTLNGIKSSIKPSCVVYNATDVWFSFVAPSEKNINLDIQAGFIYNWAIYSGTCNNLNEFACGKSPDPCSGGIPVTALTAGRTYYLQIISAVNPLKSGEGNLCVRIDELSKAPAFTKLNLELQVECLHGVLGKVNYLAIGGKGQYNYNGPLSTEIFYPGTTVEAFIEDEVGCRDFDKVTIDCQAPATCKNSNLDLIVISECLMDSLGRQSGEVLLHINGMGGSGAYYLYGTPDGSKLKHGERYQIILIDSDSCYVIEEGQIICPPFDCSQSKLTINASYECVDTLLKAILHLEVKGNLGNFNIKGNQVGDQLAQGDKYLAEVTDAAGCSISTSGEIVCKFDSCAYARPNMNVSYDCILDINGNRTGKAILNVSVSSYAGGIILSGHKNGDTLNNLDNYSVHMIDSFGCSLINSGDINCIPVSGKDLTKDRLTTFHPNPAYDLLNILIPQNKDSKIKYTVLNSDGKFIEMNLVNPLTTNNIISLKIDNYPAGLIYIKLEGERFFDIIRFIKL
ncbi:MAG: hypothetical protein WBB02_13775 [Saprospiraceae bacterium]